MDGKGSGGMMIVEMSLNPGFQFILVGMERVLVGYMIHHPADRLLKLCKLKSTLHKLQILDKLIILSQECKVGL